jgi:hypothetical protein
MLLSPSGASYTSDRLALLPSVMSANTSVPQRKGERVSFPRPRPSLAHQREPFRLLGVQVVGTSNIRRLSWKIMLVCSGTCQSEPRNLDQVPRYDETCKIDVKSTKSPWREGSVGSRFTVTNVRASFTYPRLEPLLATAEINNGPPNEGNPIRSFSISIPAEF